MYIDRDAKIILIVGSLIGIIGFVSFYIILLYDQLRSVNDNFTLIQIMIFSILGILTIILSGTLYSLKREITRQHQHIQNISISQPKHDRYVKVPYNKSGLYLIIIASALGIIVFLYLFSFLILDSQNTTNVNMGMVSSMILVILIIIFITLLSTIGLLIKRIHTPLYYDFKACPQCGSDDIFKVEYSWWGGLIGPLLVHQVRCNKCGHTYNGATGTNITKKISIYVIIMILIIVILNIIRFLT